MKMLISDTRRNAVALALATVLGLAPLAAWAARCKQIETPLGCVETVVTKAVAPSGPSMAQGGELDFRNNIAPGHGAAGQTIRSVYVPPNYDMIANKADHVRVCLLEVPRKSGSCNPSTDIRGREFLVYDKTTTQAENASVYFNGEHLCGGA